MLALLVNRHRAAGPWGRGGMTSGLLVALAVIVAFLSSSCGSSTSGAEPDRWLGQPRLATVPAVVHACSRDDLPTSQVSIPASPATVPSTPRVPRADLAAARAAIRQMPVGRAVVDAPDAHLVHAEPWTDRDGHVVGVVLAYEFGRRTDLPNLGAQEHLDNGSEEGLAVWDGAGLPNLVPIPDDDLRLSGVKSASFYVLARDRSLYLAAGSQQHVWCPS